MGSRDLVGVEASPPSMEEKKKKKEKPYQRRLPQAVMQRCLLNPKCDHPTNHVTPGTLQLFSTNNLSIALHLEEKWTPPLSFSPFFLFLSNMQHHFSKKTQDGLWGEAALSAKSPSFWILNGFFKKFFYIF